MVFRTPTHLDKWVMTMGTSPFSITACTCCWFPAVMLDKNHTASCNWNKFGISSLRRRYYLVDLLLAVVEKAWEVLQCSLKYSRIARHFILGMELEPRCILSKIETWFRTVCV